MFESKRQIKTYSFIGKSCINRTCMSHLLVVLDLVLQDDPIGSIGRLPGQWDSVPCDILCLDGCHWRGSWWDDQRKKENRQKKKDILLYSLLPLLHVVVKHWSHQVSFCVTPPNPPHMLLLLGKSNSGPGHEAITSIFFLNYRLPFKTSGYYFAICPHGSIAKARVNGKILLLN